MLDDSAFAAVNWPSLPRQFAKCVPSIEVTAQPLSVQRLGHIWRTMELVVT